MRTLKNGNGRHFQRRFEVVCGHCDSLIRGKESEFRPIGFMNTSGSWEPTGYAYTCPVCNCRRFVKANERVPSNGFFKKITYRARKIKEALSDDRVIYRFEGADFADSIPDLKKGW